MKIYEIAGAILEIQEMLENDEDVQDTLDSLELALEDKAEGLIKLTKSLDAEAKAIKEEEDRLKERRKSVENKAKWLKEYLDHNLQAAGIDKMNAGIFKISYRKTPPSVNISEGAKVPEGFLKYKEPDVDKTGLKKWLQDGNKVEGISLEQRKVLNIK